MSFPTSADQVTRLVERPGFALRWIRAASGSRFKKLPDRSQDRTPAKQKARSHRPTGLVYVGLQHGVDDGT